MHINSKLTPEDAKLCRRYAKVSLLWKSFAIVSAFGLVLFCGKYWADGLSFATITAILSIYHYFTSKKYKRFMETIAVLSIDDKRNQLQRKDLNFLVGGNFLINKANVLLTLIPTVLAPLVLMEHSSRKRLWVIVFSAVCVQSIVMDYFVSNRFAKIIKTLSDDNDVR